MNVTITPTEALSGEITAPPSKARTHRALFGGLLSNGVTTIQNPLACTDTEATANAIAGLGASVDKEVNAWVIRSNGQLTTSAKEIDCNESGVTLRFVIPIASLTGAKTTLAGKQGLIRRPIEPLVQAMSQLGVKVVASLEGVRIEGPPPKGGVVNIRGDVSSQFISGLLFAAPRMKEGLRIQLTSSLESRNYVLLTIETMKRHGIGVEFNSELSRFVVSSGQQYESAAHLIPGDYSSGAFAMAAAAITESKLLIRGLAKENSEPDSEIVEILSKMGAHASFLPEGVQVEGTPLMATKVNIRDCPDLGPVMAILACFADGFTRITGASRLRYKESDRLVAITSELKSLGAEIEETGDGLNVHGPCSLKGGFVHSHGDHRIAMALGVAALRAEDPVTIQDAECVTKSYPTFFDDLRSLGVEVVGG